MKGKAAIAGLGITDMGRIYGKTATDFAAEAIKLALDDAGLKPTELDGLLVNSGVTNGIDINLMNELGMRDVKLMNHMNSYGSTAGAMVQFAAMACAAGMANAVACVFADAPLVPDVSTGSAYASASGQGFQTLYSAYGMFGAASLYAMSARRHMELYGTKSEQFGAIAVSQREWALLNPKAQMKKPMTLADHQTSRMIAEPLRLFDCCLVSNGGVAVIVTSAERARSLKQPPVYVLGFGQGHPGGREDEDVRTGAYESGKTAMTMAGVTPNDIDVCEIYDCFTYTVLVTLEDYGFCGKGEGGSFVEGGRLGPGGSLPTNTGGGQLSSFYMWGMTPLSEAVIQARGQGGARQAPKHDVVLVSGNGGVLDYHSTLILSPHPNG
ncbi:thiolase family protein [Paenibacillus sp.]|uniref:thiolase family protein n=1 Tax=Paenibacillus sp. TaxID=58172 RepID=UPI002D6AA8CB|nr:thiolase family protein [Paenibacillus sp.]HZG83752.1 thiolase family protein [Paenibacillus sp.]